jgi:D-ribose pyranose/furanose isomerase RbsD
MPERDPIDLIKEQLNRMDKLAGLQADHEVFKQWQSETRTILEKAFSSKSIHYQNFVALRFREMSVKAFASPEIDKINAQRYRKDMENVRNILQGAIKELTLDRTLFKKLQTTPKTVEVSLKGEYFISSGISEAEITKAIESAFEDSGLTSIHGAQAIPKRETLHQRIEQIRRAAFGIYPIPGLEKMDALLEIGAALGMGKDVILICQKGSPLPETFKHLDLIEYEDFSDLTKKLKGKIG